MANIVDISKASIVYLDLISDQEAHELLGKGWSLSFVYSFRELRDVYFAFLHHCQFGTVAEFSNKYVKDIIPYSKSPWDTDGRRVLEIKNALINFGIMDMETHQCKSGLFNEVPPGSSVSEDDIKVFKRIFFSYFRFIEYASLFVSPNMSKHEKLQLKEKQICDDSMALYYFSSENNRVDSIFYTLSKPDTIYRFPISEDDNHSKGGYIRFWDTFLSWGTQLGLIEKLNMRSQGYSLSTGKSFGACYFIRNSTTLDVCEILNQKFRKQSLVDVSKLVLEICLNYRVSIIDAQKAVLDYYQASSGKISLIRTSEIFIKETELNNNDRILYPNYKGSYISHIKIRT